MDLKDVRADAKVFLAAIDSGFDCEYGISPDDAVKGLIALYRSLGKINYAEEKSILGGIAAEEKRASYEAAQRQQEYERLNPEWAERERKLQEMSRMNLDWLQRGFVTSFLGYDPHAKHEQHKESVRQWWRANGVAI